jgi:hypothetical protein
MWLKFTNSYAIHPGDDTHNAILANTRLRNGTDSKNMHTTPSPKQAPWFQPSCSCICTVNFLRQTLHWQYCTGSVALAALHWQYCTGSIALAVLNRTCFFLQHSINEDVVVAATMHDPTCTHKRNKAR